MDGNETSIVACSFIGTLPDERTCESPGMSRGLRSESIVSGVAHASKYPLLTGQPPRALADQGSSVIPGYGTIIQAWLVTLAMAWGLAELAERQSALSPVLSLRQRMSMLPSPL